MEEREHKGWRETNTNLPLRREVTITCGDTEHVCIVLREVFGCNDGIVWFRGGMHLGKNFVGEGLGDSEIGVRGWPQRR